MRVKHIKSTAEYDTRCFGCNAWISKGEPIRIVRLRLPRRGKRWPVRIYGGKKCTCREEAITRLHDMINKEMVGHDSRLDDMTTLLGNNTDEFMDDIRINIKTTRDDE